MCVDQSITNQDAIFIVLEHYLFLQNHTTDTISSSRHLGSIELSDVLVSVWTEIIALILVQTEVELGAMLDNRTVERRQQHMVLVIELGYGNYQQSVVLARITVYQCRAAVGARTVGSEELTDKTLLQVSHHGLF